MHGGDLFEFYGFTGDHVTTDALGMHTFLPSPSAIPATDGDHTSELHQPSQPQPPEQFERHEPTVKHHLAEIHARWQGDVVQR